MYSVQDTEARAEEFIAKYVNVAGMQVAPWTYPGMRGSANVEVSGNVPRRT